MDRGHKKEYFNVMYTSYKNRHANRDTLMHTKNRISILYIQLYSYTIAFILIILENSAL